MILRVGHRLIFKLESGIHQDFLLLTFEPNSKFIGLLNLNDHTFIYEDSSLVIRSYACDILKSETVGEGGDLLLTSDQLVEFEDSDSEFKRGQLVSFTFLDADSQNTVLGYFMGYDFEDYCTVSERGASENKIWRVTQKSLMVVENLPNRF